MKFVDQISNIMNIRRLSNVNNHNRRDDISGVFPVFVFDDHRSSLIPIWAALQDKIFKKPPLLIRFDAHKDFAIENVDWIEIEENLNTPNDLLAFSNSLRSDDGGWLNAVVELNYVENVVTFFLDTTDESYEEYHDHNNNIHKLIWFGRLSEELRQHEGRLGDIALSEQYEHIRNAINWNPESHFDNDIEIWFDIDFDFAVHHLKHGFRKMPWRDIDFEDEFSLRNTSQFFQEMLSRCKLITLATESAYSCNIVGVSQIAYNIQKIFNASNLEVDNLF